MRSWRRQNGIIPPFAAWETPRFDELVEYTPYAVQFRYGASDPGTMPLDRNTAVQRVEALLEEVRRRVEDIERP